MNSNNLEYIKLNNTKTYKQVPAMLKMNIHALHTKQNPAFYSDAITISAIGMLHVSVALFTSYSY